MSRHLLDDDALSRLSRVNTQSELFELLVRSTYGDGVRRTGSSPPTVESAVADVAGRYLRVLTRWMHSEESRLAPAFLPLDARAIRDLVRTLVAGRRPEEPFGEGIPTPTLSRRSLLLLASATSPGSLAATLVAWHHPLASGLSPWMKSKAGSPSLYRTEVELGRAMAQAVVEEARRGDVSLRRHAAEEIDAWNTSIVLLLAGTHHGVEREALFLPGGELLDRRAFLTAVQAERRSDAAEVLARAARRTFLESALASPDPSPTEVEDRILGLRIRRRQAEARAHPLSSAPVLAFVLRLRRESRAVRRAAWRAYLSSGRPS